MKRTVLTIAIFAMMFGTACHYEHNYTKRNCKVTEATETGAMIVDSKGWGWYYEGEGFEVGQTVDLKMHDNFTNADNEDDIIKKVVIK